MLFDIHLRGWGNASAAKMGILPIISVNRHCDQASYSQIFAQAAIVILQAPMIELLTNVEMTQADRLAIAGDGRRD